MFHQYARAYKGQLYYFDRTEPYTRVDGSQTQLRVWVSYCAQCGEPFEYRTTARSRITFTPSRRCPEHRRPGRPRAVKGGVL